MKLPRNLLLCILLVHKSVGFVVDFPHPRRYSFSLSSTISPKTPETTKVLFQTIVHAPPTKSSKKKKIPGSWILPLVEALENDWQVPERMPMPFQKETMDDSLCVLQLSSVAYPEASLQLQIVSVLDQADVCVVVLRQKNRDIPPMISSLLESSQQEVFKSLERFLQDFSLKELKDVEEDTVQAQEEQIRENQRHMVEELYESNSIIDAEVVQEYSKEASGIGREAALDSMRKPASQAPLVPEDFAVQAARRQSQSNPSGEFAVQAAKQRRRKLQQQQQHKQNVRHQQDAVKPQVPKDDGKTTAAAAPPVVDEDPSMNLAGIRPPTLDDTITGTRRTFRQSISRPEEYQPRLELRRNAQIKAVPQKSQQKTKRDAVDHSKTSQVAKNEPESITQVANGGKTTKTSKTQTVSPRQDAIDAAKDRNLNINALEQRDPVAMASSEAVSKDPAIRSTQQALDEMIEQSKDMSPEELLQDVMNFGKEAEQQEETGRGFVNGAFDTAKELLRERKAHQNSKEELKKEVKEVTPEEALKEMFQAGERLADGRIVQKETRQAPMSQKDEEMVDSLIASDKTISRHARVLDDELVELEVMIQRTPGQEYDDVAKSNPMFDVLSGPEVYNPNVDPKTAVNWPGALPGTKDVRLPKELDEAVKQANFAANVLMKIEEVKNSNGETILKVGNQTISGEQVTNLRSVVDDAIQIGLIDDPLETLAEESRLQMLVDELWTQPDERTREIVSNYKDLLLSEHFIAHVKKRLAAMAKRDLDALRNDETSLEEVHKRERHILGELVSYAQLLLKEARALGAELEASQLEVIRSICKVAMDPSLKTEEETAQALTYAVRDMRPLFDDMFIAYLKYAIAEEEGRLARAGILDDPAANEWLFVLKIIQQGVYKEISISINRYLEHIWYVLRMETASERRMLLEELVNAMPTLDVRPFVQVVENIAGALGQSAKGEFGGVTELGEMTNKVLQLYRDVREILPPERIDEKSRDADEWVAKQRKRLMDQRRLTRQRLQASQETEHLDEEIEALDMAGSGDVDLFD